MKDENVGYKILLCLLRSLGSKIVFKINEGSSKASGTGILVERSLPVAESAQCVRQAYK
jgi:hypothetical protein